MFPALSRSRWRRTLAANAVGQPAAQPVGVRGDLLRALPRRRREVHPRRPARAKPGPSGICGRCWAPRTSKPARCWHFRAATCATRSSTTCSPTCRATATPRSPLRVRALCDKYDLPYTTGSLARQYLLTLRTIHKLALPDRFLFGHLRRRAGDRFGTEVRGRRRAGRPIRCRDNGAAKRVANRVAGQCSPTPTTTKASSQTTPVGRRHAERPVAIFPARDNRSGAPTVCLFDRYRHAPCGCAPQGQTEGNGSRPVDVGFRTWGNRAGEDRRKS